MFYNDLLRVLGIGLSVGCCGLFTAMTLPGFSGDTYLWAFLGAFAAGIVCSPLFGLPAAKGWWLAVFAAILSTILGGAIGVALLEVFTWIQGEPQVFDDVIDVIFGVALLPLLAIGHEDTSLIWLSLMGATHLLARTHDLRKVKTS